MNNRKIEKDQEVISDFQLPFMDLTNRITLRFGYFGSHLAEPDREGAPTAVDFTMNLQTGPLSMQATLNSIMGKEEQVTNELPLS